MSELSETIQTTRITQGGRIVLPVRYRRALGVKEGDQVIIKLIDNEIRITSKLQELRRAQALITQYSDDDKTGSWTDELIAERRRETERE